MSKHLDFEGSQRLRAWIRSRFLGKEDRAADSALLGGKPPEYYAGPPVNLLDNSDFTNPVNQRGATSYAASGQPTIDRWGLVGDGSLNVADGYVSLAKKSGDDVDIQQNLENYDKMKGKTYTIAVGSIDGKTYATPFVMGKVAAGINLGGCEFYSVDNRNILFRVTESDGWYWAALYEGSYTADTLPPYIPKGYAAELAECQRYAVRVGTQPLNGWCYNWGKATFFVPIPTRMRINNPTVILDSSSPNFYIGSTSYSATLDVASTKNNGVIINYNHSAEVRGQCIIPEFAALISADL